MLQREYRIAPELVRCCWYVIVGSIALAVVFCLIVPLMQNRGPVNIAVVCFMFALPPIAMIYPLRWRLRIDQTGLTRRSLINSDVWTWTDLASGTVRKMHPYTLFDPQRPRWRCKLRLGCLATSDIQEVFSAINHHYRLPPPPVIPATLSIKYAFRRSVRLDELGLCVTVGGTSRQYAWKEVREVHATLMDPIRRDFQSLVINLPEQEIELRLEGGTSPSWRGATAEEIIEYLFQKLPAAQIRISIAGERPTNLTDIKYKIRHAEKQRRELAIVIAICAPLVVASFVWVAMTDGAFRALTFAVMYAIPLAPIYVFVDQFVARKIKTLKENLDSIVSGTNEVDSPG